MQFFHGHLSCPTDGESAPPKHVGQIPQPSPTAIPICPLGFELGNLTILNSNAGGNAWCNSLWIWHTIPGVDLLNHFCSVNQLLRKINCKSLNQDVQPRFLSAWMIKYKFGTVGGNMVVHEQKPCSWAMMEVACVWCIIYIVYHAETTTRCFWVLLAFSRQKASCGCLMPLYWHDIKPAKPCHVPSSSFETGLLGVQASQQVLIPQKLFQPLQSFVHVVDISLSCNVFSQQIFPADSCVLFSQWGLTIWFANNQGEGREHGVICGELDEPFKQKQHRLDTWYTVA